MSYNWNNEAEARKEILEAVAEYYNKYKKNTKEFKPGDRITYAARVFDEKEMCSLVDSALDFWLTTGRYADEFEREFANWLGVKYASLVNSGSSANLIAFSALTAAELGERQIKPGDEVITVAAGFPTTVTPVIQYGAIPVFVDVTIPQYNIDVTMLEAAKSDKTKAVMIAHTLGNPFDLSAVKAFCDKYNLWLIEDNCDALGSTYTIDGETKLTAVQTRFANNKQIHVKQSENINKYIENDIGKEALNDMDLKPAEKFEPSFNPKTCDGEKTYFSNGAIESNSFEYNGERIVCYFEPDGNLTYVETPTKKIEIDSYDEVGNVEQEITETFSDGSSKTTTYDDQKDSYSVEFENENETKSIQIYDGKVSAISNNTGDYSYVNGNLYKYEPNI